MRSKVLAAWMLPAGAGTALWLAACATGPCLAGGWEPIGPSGGDQFLVQMAPNDRNTLYSLSHHGVHVSTNRAVSWRAIHDATMNQGTFLSIAFPAHDTNNILVSRTGGGLSRTLNGGQTWEYLTNGLPDIAGRPERVTISSMVALPDGKVVAGVRATNVPPAWAYSLAPGGTNWTAQGEGLSIVVPEALLSCAPTTLLSLDAATNLWAVIYGGGVYRWSTNQWASRSAGLPTEALRATFLAHDMTKSGTALLGTEDDWVYSTTNAGATWTRLPLPTELQALENDGTPLPFVYMVAIDPANPKVIFVRANTALSSYEIPLFKARIDQNAGDGTYVTLDGGAHWFLQSLYAVRMAFDPTTTESGGNPPLQGVTRSKFSYVTTVGPESFFVSANGGSSFTASDNGIYTYFCNALSWSTALGSILVGGEEGLSRLQRGSDAWGDRIKAVTDLTYVWSFAADYQHPSNTLYSTGYSSWGFTNQMGIYRMPPDAFNGGNWTPDSNQILAGTGVWRVVTSPARPAAIYAACQEHGILLSENGGATWSNRNAGLSLPCNVTDVELDQNGRACYASFRASSGNLLAEPPEPWWLLANETGGVYRAISTNDNWELMPGLTGAVTDIEMTIEAGVTNLYATGADGIHVCRDGRTWEPLLIARFNVAYDLLVHPTRTGYLYAATSAGVRRSTDGGKQWHDFSNGLTLLFVQHLALDEQTDTLYAGTLGNSVFRQTLAPTNPVAVMAASSNSIDFGSVFVGQNATASLVITNIGEANLVITNVTAPPGFSVSPPSGLPITVTPLSWATFDLRFEPSGPGIADGEIAFLSNATNSPVRITVAGVGLASRAILQPAILDFGSVPAGYTKTHTVTVTNAGTMSLLLSNLAVQNSTFTLVNPPALPATVPVGKSIDLSVRFAPGSAADQTGSVTVVSNDPNSSTNLPLRGKGYTTKGTVSVQVTPNEASWAAYAPWGDVFVRTGDVANITLPTGVYTVQWHDVAGYALPTNSPSLGIIPDAGSTTVVGNYIPFSLNSDSDRMPDWEEYTAGTDPFDPLSLFVVTAIRVSTNGVPGVVLEWPSASNRLYDVWQTSNLLAGFTVQSTNITATPPLNIHTAAPGPLPGFYRITVEKMP